MHDSAKLGTAELLFKRAQLLNLQPAWVIPDGLFAVTIDGREVYVNFARSPLNADNSASLAKDKYLTRLVLQRHGMPNIPFDRPTSLAAAEDFLAQHQKIVAKPVKGAGAHDIHIVTQAQQLRDLSVEEYILEKYVAGQEMRYLVLNGQVIGVHHSEYGTSVAADRPLQRHSYPKAEWDEALVESSLQISQILDLHFAAIDYLVDSSGRAHVLEVNTMPGLKWFHAPTSGPIVDVAGLFMDAVVEHYKIVSEEFIDVQR